MSLGKAHLFVDAELEKIINNEFSIKRAMYIEKMNNTITPSFNKWTPKKLKESNYAKG